MKQKTFIHIHLNYVSINKTTFILMYTFFLMILPRDSFADTSLYTFRTAPGILYIWNDFYVSYLYIPIIFYSFFSHFMQMLRAGKRNNEIYPFFLFLVLLAIKDVVIVLLKDRYMYVHGTYEYYYLALSAVCTLDVFFLCSKDFDEFIKLFMLLGLVNFGMQLVGVVIGHSATSGEYAYRFTAPNMNQNSTGYLFLLCFMASFLSRYRERFLIAGCFFAGILLTGNRSGMMYCAMFILLYYMSHFEKIIKIFMSPFTWMIVLGACFLLPFVTSSSGGNNRFMEMITGIYEKGLINYIATDSTSGAARVRGMYIALEMLNKNWLLGCGFSCYCLQYYWTIYNGPSAFPHYEWICWFMILGALFIPLFFGIVKTCFKLLKQKNEFWIFGLVFVIKILIDGGMYQNSKNMLIVLYGIAILYYALREKNECFNHNRQL